MATNYISVKGYIKDGKLNADVPDDLPDGEVKLTIELSAEINDVSDEPIRFQSKTLGEILKSELIGAWADMDIGDSEEWVQEQRRKRREERQARWMDS